MNLGGVLPASAEELPVVPVSAGSADAIYLNGASGIDENDGTTEATAVKTFKKAKELAQANQDIKTIYITGTTSLSGDVSLAGTKALVKRSPTFGGNLFTIADNATLSHITVDGNKGGMDASIKETKSLILCDGSKKNLIIAEGALLQNNRAVGNSNVSAGGALYIGGGAKLTIRGGAIQDNEVSGWGGAVYLTSSDFEMSGGVIQRNVADANLYPKGDPVRLGYGGGICVWNNSLRPSELYITGDALIKENKSSESGGGISLATLSSSNSGIHLKMDGGQIIGNVAGATGGGIFVQAGARDGEQSTAEITGGRIAENRMEATGHGNYMFGGGGIYVNGYKFGAYTNGVLHLKNAIIRENVAEAEGGGLAACPISTTRIHVKQGVALYQNKGERVSSSDPANEIYILAMLGLGAHSGNPEYNISPVMLGGVPYNWTDSDGNEVHLNKLFGSLIASNYEELILNTAQTGNEKTIALGKAIIENNYSATRGGGVGSNGTVIFGESETIEVSVKKEWKHIPMDKLPESIRINLYSKVKGTEDKPAYVGFEMISPDQDGNWSITFKELPKNDDYGRELEYSVKEAFEDEAQSSQYHSVVKGNQINGFTIINAPATSVDVEKEWKGIETSQAPTVKVYLVKNGNKTDQSVELSAANDWKASFKNLPLYDGESDIKNTYSVVEDGESDGIVEVDGQKYAVIYDGNKITNEHIPNPPTKTPPTKDNPPTKTLPPRKVKKTTVIPSTGDAVGSNTAMLLVAIAGLGFAFVSKRFDA